MTVMHFGLAIDFGSPRVPLGEKVDGYVPLLELAERLGFESVFAGHTAPTRAAGSHVASPLLVLAALAPRTGLTLGTGVVLLPMVQPLNLAYDAAALDQLTHGRFVLGVGLGNPPLYKRFGVDPTDQGERADELLAALRALWAGEQGYHGKLVNIYGGIAPLPTAPGRPPLWVGGRVAPAARRAARYGDAWSASTGYGFHDVKRQSERYRAALAAEGKDPTAAVVGANRLTFIAPTDEQAWSEGRPYLTPVLNMYASTGGLRDADGQPLPPGDDLLERAAAEYCLIGSPETVAAKLGEYARAGLTHVQLRVAAADMPAELIARSLTLAAEHLLGRDL